MPVDVPPNPYYAEILERRLDILQKLLIEPDMKPNQSDDSLD